MTVTSFSKAACLVVAAFFWLVPPQVEASLVKFNQLEETAQAPVLVVGRVTSVQKGEILPAGSMPWHGESVEASAEIEVLRSRAAHQEDKRNPGERLRLRFYAGGPRGSGHYVGLYLPDFQPGQVHIFPLRRNTSPEVDLWRLADDEGFHITLPARAEFAETLSSARSTREFLLNEIANALSRGTPQEVHAAGAYLGDQYGDLRTALMSRVEAEIGDDRERWAEVATSILASAGLPRPTIDELQVPASDFGNKLGGNMYRLNISLAQLALRKLPDSPDTNRLLAQTLLANMPAHAWGSAMSLVEFADHPAVIQGLTDALKRDVPGSSYVAWTLVRNGQRAFLPEALARALKVADRPDVDRTHLQGAAALLRDYGSDDELLQLADLIRKHRTLNPRFYHALWQYASQSGNPREARILAVVLTDRRVAVDQRRYCDLAVFQLERATKQNFGSEGKTLAERDEAVARAIAWLDAQGIPH